MKTFEEKFTEWVDGRLAGEELEAFEAELAEKENALAEKKGALKLGALIRDHCQPPELLNADFFNHQLMQRIEADANRSPEKGVRHFWTLPKLAWAGGFSMALVAATYFLAVPKGPVEYSTGREYVAQILNTQTGDPSITATTIHSKDNKLTVLWLDGLEYLPSDTEQ
ncbi:MAG: hypothetical protein WCH43_04035 [Verrucomicrobiota bacterium]